MLKLVLFFLTVFLSLGSLSAQNFIGKINPFPSDGNLILQNDSLRILAVMVSFQEDRDDATFGNGKFGSIYSQNYGQDILDPLPHNKSYFESHLEFVKNYFLKVSNGKLNISYNILPDTFSVSNTMRNYSPPNNSDDFTLLADFAAEVWTKADQIYPGFNFNDYDVFLIFHAGAGRDISLPGSIGNEKDLPSVYLGERLLKNVYGNDFNGFPVSNGNFNIQNSMIIPETESRELESIAGKALIQISINGLLAASVASHLGLPDLFDTETGLSAIGRFGLMDGQSIFTYNGTFPPAPSPWEKIFLGWIEPVEISPGNYNINLSANLAAAVNDTTILKVPINSSEYFLIENRNRDVNKDGSVVTYIVGNDTITKTFDRDTTGFYSFDVDTLSGVVINVDEFDWAVPGNGILIWHIDENIINSKITGNKINVDKFNRGVDIEEADGVQDIGEQFQTIFGDVVIGEGAPEDFWYKSNPSDLYKNEFSKSTLPNSNTNSGANSLIKIYDFSDVSNKMNFKISYGDSLIKPLFIKQLSLSSANNKLTGPENSFALLNDSSLIILDSEGNQKNTFVNFSKFKAASVFYNNKNYIVGVFGNSLNIYSDDETGEKIVIDEEITAPPVIQEAENSNPQILIGTSQGKIFIYSLDPLLKTDSILVDTTFIVKKISTNENYISFLCESKLSVAIDPAFKKTQSNYFKIFSNDGSSYDFFEQQIVDFALMKNRNGENINIALNNNNAFYLINNGNLLKKFKINSSSQINSFSLADLKQGGENYIIFVNDDKLYAVNLNGTSADNFPVQDPLGIGFTGTPLAADFEGDNKSEIIVSTKDGRIFAIDGGTGKVLNGFPISAGSKLSSTPVLYNYNGKMSLAAINDQNNFSAWSIGLTEGKIFWSEENGNSKNSSFIDAAERTNFVNEFFPESKAYNYPNPVYEDQTVIHYYVAEDSKINIKIFDLAGDLVAELNDDAAGGFDNETIWNVNDVQSGVYLARIEASSSSGKTESNIIKIAIIK